MAKNRVLTLRQFHVDAMKDRMRGSDILECKATSGRDAGVVLQSAYDISLWARVIEDTLDVPCCAFGVVNQEGVGIPWLLATTDFFRVKTTLIKISKKYISLMLDSFIYLENWADARNIESIKWLEWCGFNIESPQVYGVEGLLFHRFWLKREGQLCANLQQ